MQSEHISYTEEVYVKAKNKTNKQKIQPNLTHQPTKKFSLVNFVKLISLLFSHAVKTHIISYAELVYVKAKNNNKNRKKKKNHIFDLLL